MSYSDSGPVGRLAAFGTQLVEVHLWLREELDRLVGGELAGRDLRVHCVAFCTALERHHVGEDTRGFPALEADFPELGPTLALLRRDHDMISGILARLADLARQPGDERIAGEIAGLAAIVTSHFAYEERTIVAALNRLDVPEWRTAPPEFLRVYG
ncbi:hemerythrin domain-containing protein [Herbidospora daliensis]|uniref:hemerythrin domain-containing protein n=1 Tax=Herbidospora daliensis TaxID=295585 RepID=UPI0007808776|nr:hemerythrin domain-containing protein [Herbidospora daliensis]